MKISRTRRACEADDMVRVSVCIPTRNREGELAQRLAEMRAQTLTDFELVVLDDGSTDGTEALMCLAERDDTRIRYVPIEPPLGMPAVIARCFDEAHAELVAMFHDHDSYRADALDRLVSCLEELPDTAFAFCAVTTVDPATGRVLSVSVDTTAPSSRQDVVGHFVRTGKSLVGASAVVVRRAHLPLDPVTASLGLFADVELWCRMAKEAPVGYVAEALVEVQGWSEWEALLKLNWQKHGELQALRLRCISAVAIGRVDSLMYRFLIHLSTARSRALWLARIIRYGRRTGIDLTPALGGLPETAARVVKHAASAAP